MRNRQLNGIKFRRQFSFGKYILDFYAPEHGLGIESDGGQHYDDKVGKQDKIRTKELSKAGIEILRFSNLDVLQNIEGVADGILKAIERKGKGTPSPSSSPRRGEE